MPGKLTYCGRQVRTHDRDRFLLSLFAPADAQAALWALFAFNHEIAKTREVVTETTLGLIRLQWWRDEIVRIYERGGQAPNDVLEDLAGAIARYDLPQELFEALIHAREFDLEGVLPGSLEGLENYADYTNAPLLTLALKIAGREEEPDVVRSVALSYGLTGLLRAVPLHVRQRRCYLPADLLAGQGISEVDVFAGNKGSELVPVVRVVAERAGEELSVRPQSRMLRAANKLSALYLTQLERAGYEVFRPELQKPPVFKELRVFLGS